MTKNLQASMVEADCLANDRYRTVRPGGGEARAKYESVLADDAAEK